MRETPGSSSSRTPIPSASAVLLLLLFFFPPTSSQGSCTQPDSFIHIDFDVAVLVRSNLGGEGGRCFIAGTCLELYNESTTPHEIAIQGVGFNALGPGVSEADGQRIDLRITNMTEYRSWNRMWNGVKVREKVGLGMNADGNLTDSFNVINLRAPRDPATTKWWASEFTMVQLKYELVTGDEQSPIVLPRTYLTFYDFDAGVSSQSGGTINEAMQIDPQVCHPSTHVISGQCVPAWTCQ